MYVTLFEPSTSRVGSGSRLRQSFWKLETVERNLRERTTSKPAQELDSILVEMRPCDPETAPRWASKNDTIESNNFFDKILLLGTKGVEYLRWKKGGKTQDLERKRGVSEGKRDRRASRGLIVVSVAKPKRPRKSTPGLTPQSEEIMKRRRSNSNHR